MMDGWMLRHRGGDWGNKPADASGERVAWRECKSAVIYRLAQAAQTGNGRGLLVEKFVVAYVGEPLEFGRRVQVEARAYVVADGGVWIGNIVADRFAQATGVLDFYHASPTAAKEIQCFEKHRNHLQCAARAAVSGQQWRDGIVVRTIARTFQTMPAVLERTGTPPTHGFENRTPQSGLESSLAAKLRTVSRCTLIACHRVIPAVSMSI
jgi:hypothetical protein